MENHMKGGELHEETSQEVRRQEEGLLSSKKKHELVLDAHRKVKGALRELHIAYENLDKLKEMW
jgi:hypothetical protein